MQFYTEEKTDTLPKHEQVHIVLDTQEEIDQLFAVLNFIPVGQTLEGHKSQWLYLKKELYQRKKRSDRWQQRLLTEVKKYE